MTSHPSEWHNTGGNGPAKGVWCRSQDNRTANIFQLSYRCMVDLWIGKVRFEEGIPFDSLALAQAYADGFLRSAAAPQYVADAPTVKVPRETMRQTVFGADDCDAFNGVDDRHFDDGMGG